MNSRSTKISPKDASLAYLNLQPDDILDAVETLGFPCDGRMLALNSYENRVYQIGQENGRPLVGSGRVVAVVGRAGRSVSSDCS